MKFFSLILKQKKITTFAVLLFVFFSIITPQITFAFSWWDPFGGALDGIMNGIVNGLLVMTVAGPLVIIMAWSAIAKILLTGTIAFTIVTNYTNSDAVKIGWPIVRDLANMMVVLGFVVIGIATTLRVQEYQAKKLLFPLIIAALLINFSLLISGIFIDASNIVMIFFFNKAGTGVVDWIPGFFEIASLFENIAGNNVLQFAPKLFGLMFFNFIAFFVFILYAFLLLVRVLALWTLVILSPLAFVCYVFPFTKSIWQMWWKNFFQWCVIVLPAGLFYYIGSEIISKGAKAPAVDLTIADPVTYISNSVGTVLVPGLFLIVGFFVSLQFSAVGASAIMNFANKNKGTALRGGLGALAKGSGIIGRQAGKLGNYLQGSNSKIGQGAGWLLNNTVVKGANATANYRATSQKTRSGLGRVLETMGVKDFGTTDMKQAGVIEEEAKRIKFNYSRAKTSGDKKTIERIQNDARTAQGSKGAASMKVVTDAGDLHKTFKNAKTGKTNLTEINDRLTYAAKIGATDIRKDAEKSDPNLAVSPAKIREATRRVSPSKAAEWAPDVITPEVAINLAKNTVTEIGKRGSPELVDKLKKYKHDSNKKLADQNHEWISAKLGVMKSGPVGSPERIRAENEFASLQKQLATDDNFT